MVIPSALRQVRAAHTANVESTNVIDAGLTVETDTRNQP